MSTATQAAQSETPTAVLPGAGVRYMGLATRAVAFIIDIVIIDLVAVIVAAAGALVISFFRTPHEAQTILKLIGAGLAILWAAGYFVAFWSAGGQTPGNRVMQIRVLTASGERVKPARGIVRCVGLVLAALPLFAGYLLILFNRERRGLQDWIAGTVVVEAPDLSLAQGMRSRQRAAYDAARAGAAGSSLPPSAAASPAGGAEPADERLESVSVTR